MSTQAKLNEMSTMTHRAAKSRRLLATRALLASLAFWGCGQLCLVPHYAGSAVSPHAIGWLSVAIVPPTVALLAWWFLRFSRTPKPQAAAVLSLALLSIHIPADLLFGSIVLPELLISHWPFLVFWYACFAAIPLMAAFALRHKEFDHVA